MRVLFGVDYEEKELVDCVFAIDGLRNAYFSLANGLSVMLSNKRDGSVQHLSVAVGLHSEMKSIYDDWRAFGDLFNGKYSGSIGHIYGVIEDCKDYELNGLLARLRGMLSYTLEESYNDIALTVKNWRKLYAVTLEAEQSFMESLL